MASAQDGSAPVLTAAEQLKLLVRNSIAADVANSIQCESIVSFQLPTVMTFSEAEPKSTPYRSRAGERLREIRRQQERQSHRLLEEMEWDLLIGVDATPRRIGGYCIDACSGQCHFYSYSSDDLPWKLRDKSHTGNSSEFEMKNLQFALLLWEDRIRSAKNVQIHTDNFPCPGDPWGQQIYNFLNHFKRCMKVSVHFQVTGSKDQLDFARLIQPADDLSRGNVPEATNFLKKAYNISEFRGVYDEDSSTWKDYGSILRQVREGAKKWRRSSCRRCGFSISSTGLQVINHAGDRHMEIK